MGEVPNSIVFLNFERILYRYEILVYLKKNVFLSYFIPFLYNFIFKPYNLLNPLAPLQGEIDICPRRLFCPKFDVQKLLFEAFLGIMHIFGSGQP